MQSAPFGAGVPTHGHQQPNGRFDTAARITATQEVTWIKCGTEAKLPLFHPRFSFTTPQLALSPPVLLYRFHIIVINFFHFWRSCPRATLSSRPIVLCLFSSCPWAFYARIPPNREYLLISSRIVIVSCHIGAAYFHQSGILEW